MGFWYRCGELEARCRALQKENQDLAGQLAGESMQVSDYGS